MRRPFWLFCNSGLARSARLCPFKTTAVALSADRDFEELTLLISSNDGMICQ